MGQKVHPFAFRLPIIRNWTSNWFANRKSDYEKHVQEDIASRKFKGIEAGFLYGSQSAFKGYQVEFLNDSGFVEFQRERFRTVKCYRVHVISENVCL